ncbi:MAG: ABC transporter ATP-binding protein [Clostridium sp.]|nr:ABC transporter ATP-binding protein [Clostridium sp.]
MIKLNNINKYYTMGEEKLHVLKDFSLEIDSGEFVAIMGPSGSGKSTLINLLGFIDSKYLGEYLYEGESLDIKDDNRLSQIRNEMVGFVFQNFSLIETNTVLENVELPLLYRGMSKRAARPIVMEYLEKVGIAEKWDKLPNQLSGGQQQRVAIARALINKPKFIIADEPTGALDFTTSTEIMDLFRDVNEEEQVTIILVTHDDDMAKYANRVIRIFDGRIVNEEGANHEIH